MQAYYRRLTGTSRRVRLQAARAWSVWEGAPASSTRSGAHQEVRRRQVRGRLRPHRGALLREPGFLASATTSSCATCDKIRHIPGVIVQGRYDVVCPIRSAWDLHRAWPEAKLVVVPDAGHSMSEPGIRSALIEQTARFARL